jgi:hypothetical protein
MHAWTHVFGIYFQLVQNISGQDNISPVDTTMSQHRTVAHRVGAARVATARCLESAMQYKTGKKDILRYRMT